MNVTIVDDNVLESVESVDVALGRTPGLHNGIRLNPMAGVIEITDDGKV